MLDVAFLHFHLKEYRPQYLVMASDEFYTETIENVLFNASFRRRSDFRDYMIPSGDRFVFNSPFLTELEISLEKVFENEMISIYQVAYLGK